MSFIKLGPLMGIEYVVPEEGAPQWVQNVERELGATMYPLAKLKDDFYLTPKRMGALIGHSCAFGVWIVEGLEYELKKAEREIDLTKLTTEQQARGQKIFKSIALDFYPALRRFAKRALCSCVDRPYEDMTDFLLAYSEAFSRKPKKFGVADIGNPTAEIYYFMLVYWRAVNALHSVRQLHQCLVKAFGPKRRYVRVTVPSPETCAVRSGLS